MQQKHQELKAWAESQGIDLQYLTPVFRVKRGGMGMHGRKMGWFNDRLDEPTASPSES
jgi:hypothetical protein